MTPMMAVGEEVPPANTAGTTDTVTAVLKMTITIAALVIVTGRAWFMCYHFPWLIRIYACVARGFAKM
jgi:hypothetical protein